MHSTMKRAWLVAALLLTLQTQAVAGWKQTTLGKFVQFSSIAVDADGHAHIAYLAGSNPKFVLRYAFFNGKSWRRETVDSGNVGPYNSIAVDSHGHPHIAYSGVEASSTLKYATFDGTSWTTTTVDSGGYSAHLFLDRNDHPHISYALGTIGGNVPLRYAHHDGTNWVTETVFNTMLSSGGTSIALNDAGVVYLSFCDQSGNLYLATYASGSWNIGVLDSGRRPSLALDSADRPRILYVSDAAVAIKYAAWTGAAWSFTVLPYGNATSLALDDHDHPHIAYGALVGDSLQLTYGVDSGSGFVQVPLSGLDTGHQQISLALDPLGLPHITSSKITPGKVTNTLRYARLQLPEIGGAFQDVSRTSLPSGDAVTSTLNVSNGGSTAARAQTVQFYLSDDAALDAGDQAIGTPLNVESIGQGKSKSVRFKNTFPTAVAGKHLIAVLDSGSKNLEIDEGNNTVSATIP